MTDCEALLAGIVSDPLEETRWLVLADWLQENDDPRRAELLRLHRKMLATCCEPYAHPERAEWQARMTELLVAGVRPCVPQETLTLPGGVPMTFSFIPPGAFLMGGMVYDNEKPIHRVEIHHGYFLGVYPVTQAQWFAVVGTDPSDFKGAQRPVEIVTWDDAFEFCAKLTQLTGRCVELPRESEWEFACRAGTTTDYHFGDVINTDLANYDGNHSWNDSPKGTCRKETTDVDVFPANPWSLYDLHGNVWEWCADPFNRSPTGSRDDNTDESSDNSRVLRGGSFCSLPKFCRAAVRRRGESADFYFDAGFRVCLRLT